MLDPIEKELGVVWKALKKTKPPSEHSNADIAEFLEAGEWLLALEYLQDWAEKVKASEKIMKKLKAVQRMLEE